MMSVFIDTNVYLDFILGRTPFENDATELLLKCERDEIVGYTSAISVANIAYGIRKFFGQKKVRSSISMLMSFTAIVETDRGVIMAAINSSFNDLEDAFQHYSALKIPGIDFIITRNTSDYKHSL